MYNKFILIYSLLENIFSFGKYNFIGNSKMKNSYSVFMVSYSGTCCHVVGVYTRKLKETIFRNARKFIVWDGL